MEHFVAHVAHWLLKWGFTLGAVFGFFGMSKQLAQPLAPKTVKVGRRRIRKGTLDNVLDNTAALGAWLMCLAIAVTLWVI